ncbi:Urea active transporter [Lachnellula willkommii]|uniref:Urea active transporter n=1 Tax=Lachnellula willkommii TaxID=215461 RepID=A0A559ML32_9HELO|nr:Urea active transporter [Lachnellula willkommii]
MDVMSILRRVLTLGDVTGGVSLLSQATGYGMVIGLSIIFAGIILLATKVQKLYLQEDSGKSEMFMVANRSVGTGLTASAVFSSWMWINETVFSSVMGYNYGIAGPFWFAAGLVLYTAVGGLKATFITDYLHTCIALILIIWFTVAVLVSDVVGGVHGLYDKVLAVEAAGQYHIVGNYKGSLLTFRSKGAFMFGVLHCFGNLSLMTMDTGFWQKSFASQVNSTVPGYNIASVAIFAVPWGLGTVFGLTARVIETLPIFPTYPHSFTAAQVGAGYVEPYTLYAILGTGGAVGMLLALFMSVTSTVSSSSIAVSSILSFDLYRTYINPKATDSQVVRISHYGVVFHGAFITGIALALNYGGANMTWLGYVQPIITSPAVFPTFFALMWTGQTTKAAVISPILGLATGIIIWLTTAKSIYGTISLDTTVKQAPALYGAIGSLFSPILYSLIVSYAKPKTFDWREFLRIDTLKDDDSSDTDTTASPGTSTPVLAASSSDDEKTAYKSPVTVRTQRRSIHDLSLDELEHPFDKQTLADLKVWLKIAWAFLIFVMAVTLLLWPVPLYRNYIFTRSFYTGWIVVAIFWQFLAVFAVILYPVYDGWDAISKSAVGIYRSLVKRKIGA